MTTEVVQSRLALHQKRLEHLDHLSSNYSEVNWPGGKEKHYKDHYEEMVLRGIIKELKHILELNYETA